MPKYAIHPKPLEAYGGHVRDADDPKLEFARRLFLRLEEKGWSQSELARRAGLSRDSVSTYIRARSVPSPVNLRKLSEALGCLPSDLFSIFGEFAGLNQESMLEIRQDEGDSGMMWVRVNRRLPKDVAMKIFLVLCEVNDSPPSAEG
jgi:transcriptional regulator with XRE-family HTH domain